MVKSFYRRGGKASSLRNYLSEPHKRKRSHCKKQRSEWTFYRYCRNALNSYAQLRWLIIRYCLILTSFFNQNIAGAAVIKCLEIIILDKVVRELFEKMIIDMEIQITPEKGLRVGFRKTTGFPNARKPVRVFFFSELTLFFTTQ
jgi:hypothetical protein